MLFILLENIFEYTTSINLEKNTPACVKYFIFSNEEKYDVNGSVKFGTLLLLTLSLGIMLSLISHFMTLYRLEIIIKFGVRHSASSPLGSGRERSLKSQDRLETSHRGKMKPVQTEQSICTSPCTASMEIQNQS